MLTSRSAPRAALGAGSHPRPLCPAIIGGAIRVFGKWAPGQGSACHATFNHNLDRSPPSSLMNQFTLTLTSTQPTGDTRQWSASAPPRTMRERDVRLGGVLARFRAKQFWYDRSQPNDGAGFGAGGYAS